MNVFSNKVVTHLGSNWQVVAVEPNIESVHRIQKAAQLSDTTKCITLVNNGISDERISAKIHVCIVITYLLVAFCFLLGKSLASPNQ